MKQYHVIVNLDKKQFINPHKLGDGKKLREFGFGGRGTMAALALLLAEDVNGSGGDPQTESPLIGSWARNQITIAGDYGEREDAGWGETLYDYCRNGEFKDISMEIREILMAEGVTPDRLTLLGKNPKSVP